MPNKTAEERCHQIMLKAIERGWKADLQLENPNFSVIAFWWGHRGFIDHDFAQAYFGTEPLEGWEEALQDLVMIDDDYKKLDYLEKFL